MRAIDANVCVNVPDLGLAGIGIVAHVRDATGVPVATRRVSRAVAGPFLSVTEAALLAMVVTLSVEPDAQTAILLVDDQGAVEIMGQDPPYTKLRGVRTSLLLELARLRARIELRVLFRGPSSTPSALAARRLAEKALAGAEGTSLADIVRDG